MDDSGQKEKDTTVAADLLPLLNEMQPRVSEAIITQDSSSVAGWIRDQQESRREPGSSAYVIRYHIHEHQNQSVFDALKAFDAVSEQNPVKPINTQMHAAIEAVFRTVNQQLPGRFKFERVDDSEKADIHFAGIAELYGYKKDGKGGFLLDEDGNKVKEIFSGSTKSFEGAVLLSENTFQGAYTSFMEHIVAHELGHALGLDHPQDFQKLQGAFSLSGVSFYDSAMTYPRENEKTPKGVQEFYSGYPVGFGPADLGAIARLYPLSGDDVAVTIGQASDVHMDGIMKAEIRRADGSAVPVVFPDRGLVFQPLQDTHGDTVRIGGAMKMPTAGQEKEGLPNHDGAYTTPHARVRLMQDGLEITQPNGNGSTYLPIRAEKLDLGSEMPTWAMVEDAQVEVALSNKPSSASDSFMRVIEFTGQHNRVTLNARELDGRETTSIQPKPGARVDVKLQHAEALLSMKHINLAMLIRPTIENANQDGATAELKWTKMSGGAYELSVTPRDAGKFEPITLTLELDSTNPKVVKKFELALATHLYVAGEARDSMISYDSGNRLIMPKFAIGERDFRSEKKSR